MRRLKRYLFPAVLIAAFILIPAACRRRPKPASETEDTSRAAMVLAMSDPRTLMQLLHGFYGLEGGAWRWTAQNFGVNLRVPPNAARAGAHLVLKLTLPQAQMDRLKAVTLSARINGVDVAQETYTRAGDFLYERDVPASALTEDIVAVEFSLDKVAPAPPPDARELGIVVSSVGFMGH